jgi:hypothetical protein
MKININKKHQEEILKFKKLIESHRKEEDKFFEGLIASMNISDEQVEIIWDHIYNDSDWMVEKEQ